MRKEKIIAKGERKEEEVRKKKTSHAHGGMIEK